MVLYDIPENIEPALVLYADGGTLGGSPGRGIYYSVGNPEYGVIRSRDESGKRRRSDEAEFLALLAALRLSNELLHAGDLGVVLMDCRSVVHHVRRQAKPRCARLRQVYWDIQEVLRTMLERGVRITLRWVGRTEMVRVLGH